MGRAGRAVLRGWLDAVGNLIETLLLTKPFTGLDLPVYA